MKRAPRKKVLLVDDSRIVRERLAALISELPDVVLIGEASNVSEGLKKIRQLRPHIVVLDISMPGGNGISQPRNRSLNLRGTDGLWCGHRGRL